VLDEHGFGDHGTRAARAGESGDCRQTMQRKDGQIAHRTILASSRNRRNTHEFAFAMHTHLGAALRETRTAAGILAKHSRMHLFARNEGFLN
jgi:hypothetical protein